MKWNVKTLSTIYLINLKTTDMKTTDQLFKQAVIHYGTW